MTYFEFTKRFPTENSAIDFIVATKYKDGLLVLNVVVFSLSLSLFELGMGSYQSAWRMLHQIRKAMEKEEYKETFEAIVEIDETYVGGKPRKNNDHSNSDKDNENPYPILFSIATLIYLSGI